MQNRVYMWKSSKLLETQFRVVLVTYVTSKLTSLCLNLIMWSSFFMKLVHSQAVQILDLAIALAIVKDVNMSNISI